MQTCGATIAYGHGIVGEVRGVLTGRFPSADNKVTAAISKSVSFIVFLLSSADRKFFKK